MPGRFIDTNILVYAVTDDPLKADMADQILRGGGVISVQVLNELANVLRKKMRRDWRQIDAVLTTIRGLVSVEPVTLEIHETGLDLAERHGFSLYDAMIVAAALHADCNVLLSEDMHDGLVIDRRVRITNPFKV